LKYIKSLSIISLIIVIAVLFVSCEKKDDSVIDPVLTFPKILRASISPNVYDTSDINGIAWAKVTSEEPIQRVTVTVKNPLGVQVDVFELKDDGAAPDTTAGDGKYVGRINFSMPTCRLVGIYQGGFLAVNQSGLTSSIINTNFSVINSHNLPPVCSNLEISPDSARITDTTIFVFKITVADPDGLCDVPNAFYDGTNPLGGQLTRQYLFDDGSCCPIPPFNSTSGDEIAGDGIYTRVLKGKPNFPGYYVYHLKSIDNSGAESNILSDSIYVYP
jgi:hypothetical protein